MRCVAIWVSWSAAYDVYGPVSLLETIGKVDDLLANHRALRPFGEFPYMQLRLLSAVLGSLLVPISYMTLKLMGHKSMTALVAASLFIFETGSITLHRHMLTSAPFGFFAATSIMMWVNFHNHQNK